MILSPEKPLREFEEFVVEANIDMVFSLSRSSLALFILISPLFFPLDFDYNHTIPPFFFLFLFSYLYAHPPPPFFF